MTEEAYALSPMQQGMLLESLTDRGSGVNIEQLILCLPEALEVSALERAWQQVANRHTILRSRFVWQPDSEPVQQVQPQVETPFLHHDWRGLPAAEQDARWQEFLRADRAQGFALSEAPLMRWTLFRLDEHAYRLVWTFHHVLLDGRSFPLVLEEVFACYEAFRHHQELSLPPPPPYREYIDWLQQQDVEASAPFWRELLAGLTSATSPDIARTLPQQAGEAGSEQEVRLSAAATSALRSFAEAHSVTVSTLAQGAWALLLHRYSGEADIVFGTTRACRHWTAEGGEERVGLFINTLPVRTHFAGGLSVLEWLQQLRQQQLGVRDHEHTPLTRIQSWSEIAAGSPLLHTLLVFENRALEASLRSRIPGWGRRTVSVREQPGFALTVGLTLEEELTIRVLYDSRRFDAAAIARLLGHFQTLLEGLVADPEQKIARLPMLTGSERRQTLVEWNQTSAEYPRDRCVHQLFEEQVQRTPEAIAVEFEGQTLTYRALNARANQLAHFLQEQGVGPEVLVGVCLERSLDMLVGVLGILKAGGAYAPLDPDYPADRLAFMLDDSRATVLVTRGHSLPTLPERPICVVCLDSNHERIASESVQNPQSRVSAQNLAYIIYTSGSTGIPKGVQVPHQGLCNVALAHRAALGILPGNRIMQFASLSFDASIFEIVMAFCAGSTLYLGTRETLMPGPNLARFLRENAITAVTMPPSALTALPCEALPALRTITVAGEECPAELAARWAPGRRFFNLYGPTETTIWATYAACPDGRERPSIGVPIPNASVYVLDARGEPVPVGLPGELYIGGAGVVRGYLNRADLTAEKFVPDPFGSEPGARLYRTGDLCRYLPDGNIEYLGRLDHQVKIRGFRIELGEIESALAEHAAVRETIVVAREDEPGDRRLVAYVVGQDVTGEALREHLRKKLPGYMVPSAFVFLDTLPLSPNGKIDRKALSVAEVRRREEAYVAPTSPLEETLAQIFREVLHLEQVGIHDSFFALGGHSLLATQVIVRIAHALHVEVRLPVFFENPTVASLAMVIEQPLIEKKRQEEDDIDRLLRELEDLSDEEAQERLTSGLL